MAEPLVFDSDAAMQRVDNDRELFLELVQIFFEEYPQYLAGLRDARAKAAGQKLREGAHAMKSALGNIGAMRAYALAQVIESNAAAGRMEMIDANLKTLEEEVARFKDAVEMFKTA